MDLPPLGPGMFRPPELRLTHSSHRKAGGWASWSLSDAWPCLLTLVVLTNEMRLCLAACGGWGVLLDQLPSTRPQHGEDITGLKCQSCQGWRSPTLKDLGVCVVIIMALVRFCFSSFSVSWRMDWGFFFPPPSSLKYLLVQTFSVPHTENDDSSVCNALFQP